MILYKPTLQRCLRLIPLAITLITLGSTTGTLADEKFLLDDTTILTNTNQASFVQYAVEELANYLTEISGDTASIVTDSNVKASSLIVVGPEMTQLMPDEAINTEELGDEGYILKTVENNNRKTIVVTGAGPQGTKAAVYALMRLIRVKDRQPYVSAPIDIQSKPSLATRGMHFNGWPFKYPHSFRRWSEKEWKQYLDILTYQGVNLFYLWPFMEIIPLPLSPEDQAYLEECRRIVDYAQKKHGMEVWIMQCANRVAKDNCNVPETKARPYWRPSQEDLDPANPEHFKAIMASRETLYRIINNVDGVCNIDSDPGWCFDCPLESYVKALQGFRTLLDRHNIHGQESKLMSWMWCGFGMPEKRFFDLANQKKTVELMKQELTGTWGLVPGRFDYLPICRKKGLMDRTIMLPYGMIEDEPSYPWTNVGMVGMRDTMNQGFPANPDLTGIIGNVQTPLLQLPRIYFFTSSLWDLDYRKTSEKDAMLQLASHLYPEHAQLIADCYLGLKGSDFARTTVITDRLDELVRNDRLGRLGIIGRKLFPDHRVVAQALVLQLRLKTTQERLIQTITPTTSKDECVTLVSDCLDAYLAWDLTHGWHDFWGWTNIPLVPISVDRRYHGLMLRLAKCLGDKPTIDVCLAKVKETLCAKYDHEIVQKGCIAPLTNRVTAMIHNRAPWAKATASVTPKPERYPASAANDGAIWTQYWPGALVTDNTEWFQLTWDKPEKIQKVIARFLQHPSMHGRTIHLQYETSPRKWEDLSTTVIPADADSPHAVATFQLPSPVTLDKIRIVNLLDLYELEVY